MSTLPEDADGIDLYPGTTPVDITNPKYRTLVRQRVAEDCDAGYYLELIPAEILIAALDYIDTLEKK